MITNIHYRDKKKRTKSYKFSYIFNFFIKFVLKTVKDFLQVCIYKTDFYKILCNYIWDYSKHKNAIYSACTSFSKDIEDLQLKWINFKLF